MEFWGVEVKHGAPLHVDPGEDMIVHISQVALGEKKNNGNEPIKIYLKVGDQKLIIGTLSHDKFPQLSTEVVVEKKFELSHSWKNGSVFFSGYKVDASEDGKETDNEPAITGDKAAKQVNSQVPNEDVKANQEDDDDGSDEDSSNDDDDETSSEDSGEEEEKKVTAEVDNDEVDENDSSDDDDDSDESSEDDDTPKKTEDSKKRVAEATTSKNPVSNKKAKFVTPQKSEESKKPHVHIATPHPSKAGKTSGGSNGEASKQQQTPKPAGAFGCKSCNRTFTSEMGLQSHTKAKHSAAA